MPVSEFLITEATVEDKGRFLEMLNAYSKAYKAPGQFRAKLNMGREAFTLGNPQAYKEQGIQGFMLEERDTKQLLAVCYLKAWIGHRILSPKFLECDDGYQVIPASEIFGHDERIIEIGGLVVRTQQRKRGYGYHIALAAVKKAHAIVAAGKAEKVFYLVTGMLEQKAEDHSMTYGQLLQEQVSYRLGFKPGKEYKNVSGVRLDQNNPIVILKQSLKRVGCRLGAPRQESLGAQCIAERLSRQGFLKRTNYLNTKHGGRYYLWNA